MPSFLEGVDSCLVHSYFPTLRILILIVSNFKSFSVLSYLCYDDHIFHLTSVTPRVTPLTSSLPKATNAPTSAVSNLPLSITASIFPAHPYLHPALILQLHQGTYSDSTTYSASLTPQMPSLPYLIRLELKVHHHSLAHTSLAPLLLCQTCKTTPLVKPNQVCTPVAKRTVETYNRAHWFPSNCKTLNFVWLRPAILLGFPSPPALSAFSHPSFLLKLLTSHSHSWTAPLLLTETTEATSAH